MQEDSVLQILNISDILPNRFQPRIKFDDDRLLQLAKSIDRFGVIEPIVVRPIGSKYEVIAGERRFKASKLVSKSTIPAIVLNLTDKESEEIALLENVQRQSLSPIEEAAQYKRILDNGYISREELAKKLGKSETAILSKIRLLSLSDEVQRYLLNNKISERHARSLLKLSNLDEQEEMLHRIVNERLTVKATDREIRKYIDDDVEFLFDDERGQKDMDIDKIMREAKDINESTPSPLPPVDLMVSNNVSESNEPTVEVQNPTLTSDVQVSPLDNVLLDQGNKFVTPAAYNSVDEQSESESADGVVTFDSMFKAPVSNTEVSSSSLIQNSSLSEPASSVSSNSILENENKFLNSIPNETVDSSASADVYPSVKKDISDIVADAFKKYKDMPEHPLDNQIKNDVIIPDTEIYDNVVKEVSDVPADNLVSVQSSMAQNEVKPTHKFADIVKMLRDCADNIENLGYMINVDEMDLENEYKVIFTINKD